MSKHTTPGPWRVEGRGSVSDDAEFEHYELLDERGITIADYVPSAADARLIAAAPDLLAIAKEANQFIDELCMALAKRGILAEKLLPESRRMAIGTGLLAAIAKAEVMP